MKAVTVALAAGITLAAGAASASEEGLYAGAQLGFSGGTMEWDSTGLDLELAAGTILGGFVGKDLGNQVRVEGELTYRQNDMDNVAGGSVAGEMTSLAVMGNAYYDFGDGTGFTPYLGIGVGVANVTMESADLANVNDSDAAFALQLMLGGAFPVGEDLSMTIELRSFAAVPTFVDDFGPFDQPYGVGSLSLGLRHSF